jgi:hypothetical protein
MTHAMSRALPLVMLVAAGVAAIAACEDDSTSRVEPSNRDVDASVPSDSSTPTIAPADAADDAAVDASTCALSDGRAGTVCGGACVDTTSDPEHCGSCAQICEPGSVCEGHCTDVVGSLAGLRWELPCTSTVNEANCTATDPAPVVATLGGASGTTYQATLRFRGVIETKSYEGGTTVGYLDTGGTPANDGFNVYKLEVSAPPQSYYLNAGESGVGNAFGIDYTATFAVTAGATVTLTANVIDGVEHKNVDATLTPIVVPGVEPAPAAYDGQFVQMDVVSVAPPQ